jgi:hypothetical protein
VSYSTSAKYVVTNSNFVAAAYYTAEDTNGAIIGVGGKDTAVYPYGYFGGINYVANGSSGYRNTSGAAIIVSVSPTCMVYHLNNAGSRMDQSTSLTIANGEYWSFTCPKVPGVKTNPAYISVLVYASGATLASVGLGSVIQPQIYDASYTTSYVGSSCSGYPLYNSRIRVVDVNLQGAVVNGPYNMDIYDDPNYASNDCPPPPQY